MSQILILVSNPDVRFESWLSNFSNAITMQTKRRVEIMPWPLKATSNAVPEWALDTACCIGVFTKGRKTGGMLATLNGLRALASHCPLGVVADLNGYDFCYKRTDFPVAHIKLAIYGGFRSTCSNPSGILHPPNALTYKCRDFNWRHADAHTAAQLVYKVVGAQL